jgi:hypothetical protein
MQNFLSRAVGRLFLIAPIFFLALTVAAPMYAVAAPNPNDENNLLNVNACQNFSKENSKTETYSYILKGNQDELSATMFPALANCLHKLKMETSAPSAPHAVQEDSDDKLVIENVPQTDRLQELAASIENATSDKNDQARITANLVQNFKYNDKAANNFKYPYDVAYKKEGICNETAKLIVSLLKQLGFGAAILTFEKDDHQAAGIKCAKEYSYHGTGYCFIEPTSRAIITDSLDTKSEARVNVISDGLTFDASQDFQDAQKFAALNGKRNLPSGEKTELDNLKKKYGI